MLEMQDTGRVFAHRFSQSVHAQLVEQKLVFHRQRIVFNGQQGLETHPVVHARIKRHDGLSEPEEKPTG